MIVALVSCDPVPLAAIEAMLEWTACADVNCRQLCYRRFGGRRESREPVNKLATTTFGPVAEIVKVEERPFKNPSIRVDLTFELWRFVRRWRGCVGDQKLAVTSREVCDASHAENLELRKQQLRLPRPTHLEA